MHGRATHEIAAFQERLDKQALRTRHIREPLYEEAALQHAKRILDVGSGSGAVAAELAAWSRAEIICVDSEALMAHRTAQQPLPALIGDGRRLPFADATFDAAVCNLTLMWCPDPARMVAEMARVVRPGGTVLATMEPDYGGKVHHPENPLVDLVFKGEGIRRRGGDPHAGRRLRDHFVRAGLQTKVGIGNADVLTPEEDIRLWRRNRNWYRRMLGEAKFTPQDIDGWEHEYLQALEDGIQLSWFPFFHAIGRKPGPDEPAQP